MARSPTPSTASYTTLFASPSPSIATLPSASSMSTPVKKRTTKSKKRNTAAKKCSFAAKKHTCMIARFKAAKEVEYYTKTVKECFPKKSIYSLIDEVLQDITWFEKEPGNACYSMKPEARAVIHTASEAYLVKLFDDAYKIPCRYKRHRIEPEDIKLIVELSGEGQLPFIRRKTINSSRPVVEGLA